MSQQKITATKTGTLFYTKLGEANGRYRVRFRSFKQVQLQNRQVQQQLNQMQTNYNFFKYGKSESYKGNLGNGAKQSVPKIYKNMKDRSRDSEQLKVRLKSMRQTRKSLFERIKSMND